MNRKEFKNLLTEWGNLVNNNLLLEISRNDVIEVIGEDDYNILKQNRKASQDQNFLKVIINTYKAGQAHSITDILGIYQSYIRFIASRWNRGESADIDVPGGLRASLEPDSTTYDSMLEFIDAASSMTLKSKSFIKCLEQDDINSDFEVVLNDSEWIICYPKTIRGSISLARSFWNGERLEYDKTVRGGVGQYIGRMGWCTSTISGGNMFLNYHRQMNLHMYYCIKKNTSVKEPDRKLCISFVKNDGKVSLMETGMASVDANNNIIDEKGSRKYIGRRFTDLLKDAKKPERLEIDAKSYYESISLEQYRILRAATENEDAFEDYLEHFIYDELTNILNYSKDRHEIALSVLKDKDVNVRNSLTRHPKLTELDPSGDLIRRLLQDENSGTRLNALNYICRIKEIKGRDELIKEISQSDDISSRAHIAQVLDMKDLNRLNLLDNFLSDTSSEIKQALVTRADSGDLLKLHPDLVARFLQDDNHFIRAALVHRIDNIIDPSGDLIRQLVQDEHEQVRMSVAYREDLSDDLIMQLAQDEDSSVRKIIAQIHGEALLELDYMLVRQLGQDEDSSVRRAIKKQHDRLLKFPDYFEQRKKPNSNESIIRSYIKNYIVKG